MAKLLGLIVFSAIVMVGGLLLLMNTLGALQLVGMLLMFAPVFGAGLFEILQSSER